MVTFCLSDDEDIWFELIELLLACCGCLGIIFISESEVVSFVSKKSNKKSSFAVLFKEEADFKLIYNNYNC